MERRDFLRTAGGATVASAAGVSGAAPAAAQETKTVKVGPNGQFVFTPGTSEPLYVKPGTAVEWVWESDNHNIVPGEIPEEATWEGTAGPASKTYNTGHTYEHSFEVKGKYHYWCEPHKQAGMVADVVVNESGKPPGGGGGGGEQEPKEMGVPLRAHYVGIAAVLGVFISLVFAYFQLKYGESPHASGGGN